MILHTTLLLHFIFSPLALAMDENTAAVDSATGNAIAYRKPILSNSSETKNIVDRKNMRIEIGPSSALLFKNEEESHLLRGSMISESSQERVLFTANSKIQFRGKIILSYDYREKSSSIFVLFGNAKIENSHSGNSEKKLENNQGAVMITGDFYPSVLRNLSFTQVDVWLKKFGWEKNRRQEIAANLPQSTSLTPELAAKENHSERNPSSENKSSLLNYFSTVDEINEIPTGKYEKEFTNSALRGKEHSSLENTLLKKEEISIISPEDAAIISLPELNLKPGFSIIAKPEGDEKIHSKKHIKMQRTKRLPASLKRSVVHASQKPKDPVIARTLDSLDQVEQLENESARTINSDDSEYKQLDENF